MPTIDVLDATGAVVAVEMPNPDGRTSAANSRPVAFSTEDLEAVQGPDVLVTGTVFSAVNTDLLTGAVNGWFDAGNFRTSVIQIIASAGVTAGAITFEQTNVITLASGVTLPVQDMSAIDADVSITSQTIAANTARIFGFPIQSRFVRVRISTAFVGGTVRAVANFSKRPWSHNQSGVRVLASSAVAISNFPNPIMNMYVSAAGTNATLVRNNTANIYNIVGSNLSAAVIYLKIYNKATAPVVGTDIPVLTIPLRVGQVENFDFGSLGIRLNNGIGFALTTGIAHTDTGAVTANAAQFLVSHL